MGFRSIRNLKERKGRSEKLGEAPAVGLTAATCGCGVNSTSAPPVPAASSRPEPWPTFGEAPKKNRASYDDTDKQSR